MRRELGIANRVSIPKPGAPCTSRWRYRPVEAMDATVEEEVELTLPRPHCEMQCASLIANSPMRHALSNSRRQWHHHPFGRHIEQTL